MEELIGKIIQEICISSDKTVITFKTDQGPISYETYGDCCSHSWIEHFENPESLIGGRVESVESVDMDSWWAGEEDYGDHIKQYGVRLCVAGRSPALLEYRNSSNGYYGGALVLSESDAATRQVAEDF